MMFVITAASKWNLYKGGISTAFLQGESTELERQVYGEAPPELLSRLNVDKSYVVQFEEAVCGFVHAV